MRRRDRRRSERVAAHLVGLAVIGMAVGMGALVGTLAWVFPLWRFF